MSLTEPAKRQDGVRALLRGLDILRYVNTQGAARPGEISRALDIPRPTVYRLLETLEEAGYVVFSSSSNLVRITRLAASLGDSSQYQTDLCRLVAPLFARYAKQLIWPLDLSVYDNAAMVIQETTHGRSPLSIDRAMTGSRLPMLRTSAGRAYLAFCPEAERLLILDHLRRLGDPADMFFLDNNLLDRMMAETRQRGYALRDAGEFRAQTASFAVPVLSGGQLRGCVSMIWIRAALKTQHAIELGAAAIQSLVAELGADLEAQERS